MRYLALILVFLAATPLAAQQIPEVLNDHVFIHDIEEHRIIVSAPFGFVDTELGAENLHAWADFACRLYPALFRAPRRCDGGHGVTR